MSDPVENARSIEKCVLEYQHGFQNDEALNKIATLVSNIRFAMPAARYEAETLLDWARVLYSARKHEKYPGGGDGVRSFVLQDCQRLRMKLERLREIALYRGEQ